MPLLVLEWLAVLSDGEAVVRLSHLYSCKVGAEHFIRVTLRLFFKPTCTVAHSGKDYASEGLVEPTLLQQERHPTGDRRGQGTPLYHRQPVDRLQILPRGAAAGPDTGRYQNWTYLAWRRTKKLPVGSGDIARQPARRP